MGRLRVKIKSILETAGNFIFSFITAVVVLVAVIFVLIKLLGWNMFTIDSGSMSPQYPVNTLVIVQDITPEEIKLGDVITYVLNEDGVLVTHRVVGIDSINHTFTTKGDANNSEDTPVLWDNVVGKVFLGIPALGEPMRYLTDPENRPIVITVIVLLFVVSFVWDLAGRKKKKRKDEAEAEAPADADVCAGVEDAGGTQDCAPACGGEVGDAAPPSDGSK